MKSSLINIIETGFNRLLTLDPDSKTRLAKLENKVASITLLPFEFSFQFQFTENGVKFFDGNEFATDIHITGTPLNLLGASLSQDKKTFFADDVNITGDLELAQSIIALFNDLDIDIEDHLANYVGDVPAYHLGKFSRNVRDWFRNSKNSLMQNASEFIHEEAEWFPSKEALADFFADIDTLRMDADRLQANVLQLEKNLHAGEE